MRLRQLDLTRYGKFTDFTLDFGEKTDDGPDFHIIYGLNEAGKSTAFSGYLDLLFGIENQSRYGFLHGYDTMEMGATLDIGGHQHALRRFKQRAGSLRNATGEPVAEALLGGALAGLSREAYRMMFSLDDQTLEEGGRAILESKGDLGELLFAASAGLAGLSKILASVEQEAEVIFRKRAAKTEIASLKRRLSELKDDREEIDTQANAHAKLVATLKQAEAAYAEATQELAQLKARKDDLDGLIRAAPHAADHASLGRDLAELGDLPRPPGHWTTHLPELMVTDATLAEKLRGADDRLGRLRAEIEGVVVDEPLLRLDDRVQALQSLLSRFQSAEGDLPKRRTDLAERESQLAHIARSLGGAGDADLDALVVDAATLGTLRALLERWSGIEMQHAAAAQEREVAATAFEQAIEDRAALARAHPPLDPALRAALQTSLARIREAGLSARHPRASKAASEKKRIAEDALSALAPWSGSAEEVASLTVPSSRQFQDWRDALTRLCLRRDGHREQSRSLATQQAILDTRIATAEAGVGTLSDEQAGALRRAREEAWAAHLGTLDPDSASRFERAMRALDTLSEARLAATDRLAEIRGLRADLATTRVRAAHEGDALAEAERDIAALAATIGRASPAGFGPRADESPAETITKIEDWAARRERALTALQEARAAHGEFAEIEAEITHEGLRLSKALATNGVVREGLDLGVLLHASDTLLAMEASQVEARAAAEKTVTEAERKLKARHKADAEAAEASEAWRAAWSKALSGTWLVERTDDLDAVRAMLKTLDTLPVHLSARDEIRHRVAAMEADRERFYDALSALLRDLGDDLDRAGSPAEAARSLLDRRAAALHARAARDDKTKELSGAEMSREGLLEDLRLHESQRREILAFFAADDLTEAEKRLRLCARRDQIEEKREALTAQIIRDTSAVSLDVALARLAEIEPSERTQAEAECVQLLQDLEGRRQTLFAQRSAAADKLAAIGGDDAAARLDGERRTVMMEIEDKAVRYLRLKAGIILAERAIQTYRETHRGSMMRRASEAFRGITRGFYSGLTTSPEKDREILIALPKAGGSKNANDLSKGTRFQLYLALRVAGYEEFASSHQPVPFIADDIMETFDEPRSKEVLVLFEQMSRRGQVIYFTHHRHICDLAIKVVPKCRLHELPPEAIYPSEELISADHLAVQ